MKTMVSPQVLGDRSNLYNDFKNKCWFVISQSICFVNYPVNRVIYDIWRSKIGLHLFYN